MQDEMDILKEVGNIVAGNGSVALSGILDRKIMLGLPSMEVLSGQEKPKTIDLQKVGIAIFSKIVVGLRGEVIFLLDEKNAFKLLNLSCRVKDHEKQTGTFTEFGLSLIKEIGNIVLGSYLNALSLILKRMVVPSLPTLISGVMENILTISLSPYGKEEYTLLLEVKFDEPQENISGSFYLILTPEAVWDIKETCKKMLQSFE